MKKFMAILLVLTLSGSMLAGCGKTDETSQDNTPPAVTEQEPVENDEAVAGEMTKIGIGHIVSIAKSKDAEGENGPTGQVDTVLVAAGFDKDGKVVSITIDNAQTRVGFDKDLKVTADVTQKGKTKVELGPEYGMIKASQIGKEWFEQAAALGEWMTGKTIAEIKAVKVKVVDENHKNVPDVPELTSAVTITIEDYIAAVEEAYNNAVEIKAGAEKLGLGTEISIAKSKSAEGDKGPVAQVDTSITVAAFNADGKVAGAIIDHVQTKVEFDAEGKLTTDKNGEFQSKNELKEGYGMIKASQIGKEWYEQAAALADWFVGKDIAEIKALKVKEVDANHKAVPDVPELTSAVTISVEANLATVEKAYNNAK